MTTRIERDYGPCYPCGGTGKVAMSYNPLLVILSLGTSADRNSPNARTCPICKGTGRVVTKEIEIKE